MDVAGTQIKHTSFVAAALANQKTIPIITAEKGPGGYGLDIGALTPQKLSSVPKIAKPTDLLIGRAADMNFGDGDGEMVAIPNFSDAAGGTEATQTGDADGLDISVRLTEDFRRGWRPGTRLPGHRGSGRW